MELSTLERGVHMRHSLAYILVRDHRWLDLLGLNSGLSMMDARY